MGVVFMPVRVRCALCGVVVAALPVESRVWAVREGLDTRAAFLGGIVVCRGPQGGVGLELFSSMVDWCCGFVVLILGLVRKAW